MVMFLYPYLYKFSGDILKLIVRYCLVHIKCIICNNILSRKFYTRIHTYVLIYVHSYAITHVWTNLQFTWAAFPKITVPVRYSTVPYAIKTILCRDDLVQTYIRIYLTMYRTYLCIHKICKVKTIPVPVERNYY